MVQQILIIDEKNRKEHFYEEFNSENDRTASELSKWLGWYAIPTIDEKKLAKRLLRAFNNETIFEELKKFCEKQLNDKR